MRGHDSLTLERFDPADRIRYHGTRR
jgi:hypothetical protein